LLDVTNVSTYYGQIEAVKDVSISIKSGEIISIIGNNGAGKTTLINTISGLIKPKKGSITFNGVEITTSTVNKIVNLGIVQVPEGREVFSSLTVKENLELGAYSRYKKESKEDIYKSLEDIYMLFPILKMREKQVAGTLSGGEQQMLAIGRGLMSKPKLMLLDEPSLGLAPLVVEEVFETVKKLNKSGTTFIIVEQNAFTALKYSERAYIFELGKVVLQGNSRDLLNDPKIEESFLGKKAIKIKSGGYDA